MKGMTFKKALLLGGIFLLSTLMFAQLSWGCDDDDKRDCDDHDKPCHPPRIQRVFLDYQTDSIVFEIFGKNFERGAPLVVTLGGIYDLTVDEESTDDNRITATLSKLAEKKFEFGDYRLVVSTCRDSACKDKYCKNHGPKCKCKYCKDDCSKCKDKDDKDNECRCKDRYSLTIAGPPGPPSGITLTTVPQPVVFTDTEGTLTIEGRAVCSQGGLVTGGGFSCPDCSKSFLNIRVNGPLQDPSGLTSGWHLVGDYTGLGDGRQRTLTIYAICAQGQQSLKKSIKMKGEKDGFKADMSFSGHDDRSLSPTKPAWPGKTGLLEL